jgi:Ran GTPase-activating protein (RanGAP) involved in mRNA processing and transport
MIDRTVSESIVEQLSRVKIINLSHNRIGKVACDKFTELFFGANTRIEELYLQDNSLLDNGGVSLLTNLADYGNLRVLNLSKNFLSHKFTVALK